MKYDANRNWFECLMGNLKCFFSLVKIGFLIFRVMWRTREKDVFIEAKNWLCEKTRLPLKLTDRRFHSAARPQNVTAEWVPREAGELRLFHSAATDRRSNRRIRPDKNRGPTAVSFGGFGTAVSTRENKCVRYERRFRSAVGNRRSKPQKNSRRLWSYSAV